MIHRLFRTSITVLSVMALLPSFSQSAELPDYHHLCLDMANGAFYDDSVIIGTPYVRDCTPIAFEQYYHKHDNPTGGYNEIHLTTDYAVPAGDVYVSDAPHGTFYITDTGGKGYVDETILLVSIRANTLPQDFAVRIQSSGYVITTNSSQIITGSYYEPNALDETFTAQDFVNYGYGPQTWKPAGTADYPLWFGQDVNDPATASLLLFIDLNVASVKDGMIPDAENNGAAKVTYTFTGLPVPAAFNIYGFNFYSSQGQGISWTNDNLSDLGASGLVVNPQESSYWAVAEAEAASRSGAGETGAARAASVLFAMILPMALVTGWKLFSGRLRLQG